MISCCPLHTCHQILANTDQEKRLRNIYIYITGYLHSSMLNLFPIPLQYEKAKKMASKALPYSLLSNLLTLPSKQQPCYFRLVPESS